MNVLLVDSEITIAASGYREFSGSEMWEGKRRRLIRQDVRPAIHESLVVQLPLRPSVTGDRPWSIRNGFARIRGCFDVLPIPFRAVAAEIHRPERMSITRVPTAVVPVSKSIRSYLQRVMAISLTRTTGTLALH
jgi:hypothetical protein